MCNGQTVHEQSGFAIDRCAMDTTLLGESSATLPQPAQPHQGFGSTPMRSLTADRIRCLHPKVAFGRFAPKRAPKEIGSAPTRLPMRGRAEHRPVADRAAPTSPRRCSWRIPSRCAKPPLPSCPLPMLFLLCGPCEKAFLDQCRPQQATLLIHSVAS